MEIKYETTMRVNIFALFMFNLKSSFYNNLILAIFYLILLISII